MSARGVVRRLESELVRSPPAGSFSDAELAGLPEPVRRYLTASIADGAPLTESVQLRMRGRMKVGRWLPFRARQTLTPHQGFVWSARAAGLISGYDAYADGRGTVDWRLVGVIPVAHSDGPDASRASAERGAAEAIWVPTALLPRFGVTWSADDDRHLVARTAIDGHAVTLHLEIDDDGTLRSFAFDRWREPTGAGAWATAPFGGRITATARFGGLTIPSAGRVGWDFGTDRWATGEFFRYEITELAPR